MKKLIWFLFGISVGFVVAHFVNKDPRGREVLAEVDARISEFTDRMSDAYHEQETALTALVDDAAETVKNAVKKATD